MSVMAPPHLYFFSSSTTSSAAGGIAAYETRKAVDEYLQFHFGADQDILPYPHGPKVCDDDCLART